MRVLIIEDDAVLRDGLQVGLRLAGFSPESVGSLEDARGALRATRFEVLVLDLMLPDGSGLDLLAELRRARDPVPVLVLTARDRPGDKVRGLDLGADDYLGKPFDLEELAARLRALGRRPAALSRTQPVWNGVILDLACQEARRGDTVIPLSPREFSVLQALMAHPRAILSKSRLEEHLYGWQEEIDSNTVEVHVHKLRTKLGHSFIETVRGAGYRLAEPA
ncbi:response regulator [Frigidibacter albus]|uniref:Response regulator n=1 Tax=Frigidibacter albus TaxID=1465486 RepID=A0A6L8VFR7_9RHOB|nr:response regulator transcription factor [Frigidibacter albus]MZQ89155.1 response regulator [Frigidibacter albus]NBE30788.1 response regulator [Frigidibacter albus]GGH51084.1 DNA-binding response regulator [Frigidibacter albus]